MASHIYVQKFDPTIRGKEKQEQWISVSDALKLSGVCPRTFYAKVNRYAVPRRRSKLDGRKRLINIRALERAMAFTEGSYVLRLVQ